MIKGDFMLKVGVIGVGRMGINHARIYNEFREVSLVAVADTNKENLSKAKEKYNCNIYEDYKEMLDREELDAVSIAVPTKEHYKVALDCIDKNINLLIEKPIASNVKEGREIIEKAKEKKVKLMIGHVERFNPAVIELKRRVDNGELGKIYRIMAQRESPFPLRISDVGVVIDLAVHDIDIMGFISNSNLKRVYAETGKRLHSSNEDLLLALFRFDDDVIGVISTNWLTPDLIRNLVVTGEKGMFKVDYLNQELYFYHNAALPKEIDYKKIVSGVEAGDVLKIKINKDEPLKLELKSFVDSILEDKEIITKGEDGLKALEIAQKIIESADKNEVVELK